MKINPYAVNNFTKPTKVGFFIYSFALSLQTRTSVGRHLTAANNENLPVLTLSHADEKSIPAHAQHKRSPVSEVAKEKIFPGARNFK